MEKGGWKLVQQLYWDDFILAFIYAYLWALDYWDFDLKIIKLLYLILGPKVSKILFVFGDTVHHVKKYLHAVDSPDKAFK